MAMIANTSPEVMEMAEKSVKPRKPKAKPDTKSDAKNPPAKAEIKKAAAKESGLMPKVFLRNSSSQKILSYKRNFFQGERNCA